MSKSIKLKDNNYWDSQSIIYNRTLLSSILANDGVMINSSFSGVNCIANQGNNCGNISIPAGKWIVIFSWTYEGANLRYYTAINNADWSAPLSAYDSDGWVSGYSIGYVNNTGTTNRNIVGNVWPTAKNITVRGTLVAIRVGIK